MKKGQGALEYLMTYGWALLVIVIVAAALFGLGVLNPASYQQKRCSGFQYFVYSDQKLSTGQFVLDVRNSNQAVGINNMTVGSASAGSLTISSSNIQPGDRFTITTNTVPSVTSGNTYSYTVIVGYNVTNGIANNVDRATCVGTVA